MADLNNVTMIGRLTKDCESKSTQSGTSIVRFSIANNQREKAGNEWKDKVSYYDVTIFGNSGLVPYLKKGQQVAFTGRLNQSTWEKDGKKQSRIEIIAEVLQLIGKKEESKPVEDLPDYDFPD